MMSAQGNLARDAEVWTQVSRDRVYRTEVITALKEASCLFWGKIQMINDHVTHLGPP